MDSSKDNCSVPREELPRASAVIVASRPLERPESVTVLGEDQQVLPALLRIGRISLIERLIIRLQTVGIAPIVVITGFKSGNLEKHLVRMNVVSLHNDHWSRTTLFDDAIKGLSYIDRTCRDCEKIFLMTPMIPSVDTTTLTRLLSSPSSVTVPVYEGEDGLPIVFRKDTVQQLARAEKGHTFEELIASVPGAVERIALDDRGVLPEALPTDLFEGCESCLEDAMKLPMRVRFKLSLAREKIFFGPGPAVLLRLIDETGSVRMACQRMKLSYSKGWQILNLLEEQLGENVIVRKPGGQEGGSSTLTDTGRELLRRYEQLSVETQQYVNDLFEQLFKGLFAE
ncbi:MAG: NTP transferase domain-containing protein [Saccharofermentanales bacterium]|jgi:molybdenum cofactor cytidylyltransferase